MKKRHHVPLLAGLMVRSIPLNTSRCRPQRDACVTRLLTWPNFAGVMLKSPQTC
jgi:hypothetical protein